MPAMHSLFELLIAERKYGSCVRKWTKTGTTRQSGKTEKLRRLQKPRILGGDEESGIPGGPAQQQKARNC